VGVEQGQTLARDVTYRACRLDWKGDGWIRGHIYINV
jgi:hypothetical protein